MSFGQGGPNATRVMGSTGRIQGGFQLGMQYPNPFFDVAHTYLPRSVRDMFRWCRYYFMTSSLINAATFKLSEYPVTDVVIQHPHEDTRQKWLKFLNKTLRIRFSQIEGGLDYNVYGNALFSVSFPFIKYLTCAECKVCDTATNLRPHWQITNYQFRLTCPKCKQVANAKVQDKFIRNPAGIRLLRWNPEDVETSYNDITGDQVYYYNLPASVKNDIVLGRKEVIEKIPQLYLQSVAEQKSIVFQRDGIFHMKRPTLAQMDRGWGTPPLLPILKDLFQLQVLKKAQETICLEHILPLRVMFPQAGSGSADPYTSIDLGAWKDQVAQEVSRWKLDRNYIPILPLPIGNQTIGGDGRAMMLTGEIESSSSTILAGLGVPKEFLFGGLTWSGGNASMRLLENSLLRYMEGQCDLLNWVIQQVASFMEWPLVEASFKPFKMADDLQRKSFDMQLNQAGKLSDTTLMAGSDYDAAKENAIMETEAKASLKAQRAKQIAQAEIQGEVMLITSKYQAKAQAAMQPPAAAPPAPGEPGAADPAGGGTPGGQEAAPEAPPGAPPPEQGAPPAPPQPGQPPAPAQDGSDPMQQMQSPLGMEQRGGGVDILMVAQTYARAIKDMPPAAQAKWLANLESTSPDLVALVQKSLVSMGVTPGPVEAGVDMRVLPEVLPPRRASG